MCCCCCCIFLFHSVSHFSLQIFVYAFQTQPCDYNCNKRQQTLQLSHLFIHSIHIVPPLKMLGFSICCRLFVIVCLRLPSSVLCCCVVFHRHRRLLLLWLLYFSSFFYFTYERKEKTFTVWRNIIASLARAHSLSKRHIEFGEREDEIKCHTFHFSWRFLANSQCAISAHSLYNWWRLRVHYVT